MNGIPVVHGSYSPWLVALSLLVALGTSYTALDLARRVTANSGGARLAWLLGGAFAMGSGIWCMHYIGMLAFRLPTPVYYHLPTVGLSLLAAILASFTALYVVSRRRLTAAHVIEGSTLMGLGIAAMHYTGMRAMRSAAMHHYSAGIVILSVALAVLISLAGLLLMFYSRTEDGGWKRTGLTALALGLAIPITHYTGMAATSFHMMPGAIDLSHAVDISNLALMAIMVVTFMILGFALVTGMVDRRLSEQQTRLDGERERYRRMFDEALVGVFALDAEGHLSSVNPAMAEFLGYPSAQGMLEKFTNPLWEKAVLATRRAEFMALMLKDGYVRSFELEIFREDGNKIWITCSVRALMGDGAIVGFEGMFEDITERKLLREQLLQAQKLESVGQLAAGIAHEINTPTQFIGDNVRFLQDSFGDLAGLIQIYRGILSSARSGTLSVATIEQTVAAEGRANLAYLLQEIPDAIAQALEGVLRISTLVGAMKEFSHPGTKEKVPLDLNHAIQSTITVARNEWKYVAELELDLDPALPLVACQPGEFNQVILNIIVNAAHAIEGVVAGTDQKGRIRVVTRNTPSAVEIRITDTGAGIPADVQPRIFDPFFTTKEIGKGTGQGLAIARSVIVDKHGGTLDFETMAGKGTTFIVRLPHIDEAAANGAPRAGEFAHHTSNSGMATAAGAVLAN